MSPQHDAVSDAVNQALNIQDQLKDLKKQIFHVADELSSLSSSYDALQVISSSSGAESVHVGAVLYGLNYRFETLLTQLEALYKTNAGSSAG